MKSKLPQEVVAAVRKLEQDPDCEHDSIDETALMDFKVYPTAVALVIWTGQKYIVERDGLEGGAYEQMTVSQLRDLATERGLDVPSRALKAELIDMLESGGIN